MNKKVQLNDMELNQVAGGGWSEFWQNVTDFFKDSDSTTKPDPFPHKPLFK